MFSLDFVADAIPSSRLYFPSTIGPKAPFDYWSTVCGQAMRTQLPKRGPTVVRVRHRKLPSPPEYDVAVCGGVLGLLVAIALQVCPFTSCSSGHLYFVARSEAKMFF